MDKLIRGILNIILIFSIFEIGLWALNGIVEALNNRPILFIPLLVIVAKMLWECGIKR